MIKLSKEAAEQVQKMLNDKNDAEKLCLRIGVQHGGCSGFSYTLGFDQKQKDDSEFLQHGVRVVISNDTKTLLDGVMIDYKENELGGGFSIHNPNADQTCGCGSSFKTSKQAGTPDPC